MLIHRNTIEIPSHIHAAAIAGEVARQQGHEILIIGGIAFDLLTNFAHGIDPLSSSSKDIDILGPDQMDKEAFIQQCRELGVHRKIDFGLNEQVRLDPSGSSLRWKHIDVPTPNATFQPHFVEVGEAVIPVAPAETLYQLLKISHGVPIRQQDTEKSQTMEELFGFSVNDNTDIARTFREYQIRRVQELPFLGLMLKLDIARSKSRLSPIKMIHKIPGGMNLTRSIRRYLLQGEASLHR